ncbi:MAG: hypothetical protein K8T91_10880 [Planctomycetes bacterium]|nr:hypothetical protein [Planctomycetota bacterium]
MGLTIHYALHSRLSKPKQAHFLIGGLRRRALDLPFETVGEIVERSGAECDFNQCKDDDPHRWLLIQAGQYVSLPGSDGRYSFSVVPTELVAFETFPGPGCEPANFGLCRYPATIEIDDPEDRGHKRRLRTNLSGWRWSSFCKTQYASNPEAGGVPNFLRCHLAVVRLLDYAKQINILDNIYDEGEYWENRNAPWLSQQVGQWNETIAAAFGKLKDQVGDGLVAEIAAYPNFEHLEARGRDAVQAP